MTTQEPTVGIDDVAYEPPWPALFAGLISSIALLVGAFGVLCIAEDETGILASFAVLASPWLLVMSVAALALLIWALRAERLAKWKVPRTVKILVIVSLIIVSVMFIMGQIRYGWSSVIWFT
ncbi:MAG: hypothetical protein WKF57_12840 [Nakamurella sp.]